MATKKADNGKVAVTIPRAKGHEDPNFFVSINGVATLIPKGQTVEVPPEVAEEIFRSQAAEVRFYDKADQMKAKA